MEKHISLFPLRYRPASGNDPDYNALGIPPNTGVYTVASGEAGDFIHALLQLGGQAIGSVTVAFDSDEATTAEAMAVAIQAALTDGTANGNVLARYIHRAWYPGSGDAYYVHYKVNAKPFTVELTAPGSATLTASPGARWPQAVGMHAGDRPQGYPAPTAWEVKVKAVDADGVFLPNAGTYTMQIVQGDPYTIPPSREVRWDVGTRGSIAGTVGQFHRVEANGAAELTVRLTSLSSISGSAAQLIIDAHPVLE